MLPQISSENFLQQDPSLVELTSIMGSRDFIRFVDGMNDVFIKKFQGDLEQS